MTTDVIRLDDREKEARVVELLNEQAVEYVVNSLVNAFDKEGWDPTVEPTEKKKKNKEESEPLTADEKAAAKRKLDIWAHEIGILGSEESLLEQHDVEIAKTYYLHWVWKEEGGHFGLYLARDEARNKPSKLPAKPTIDGKAEIARAFRVRNEFNAYVDMVAEGVDIGAFVDTWGDQLGVNAAFTTVYVDMLYRYQLASGQQVDTGALDKYMTGTLPTKSLMATRDPENWEAAAAFAVINGVSREQAIKDFMLDKSVTGIRDAVGVAIRRDGITGPLKFADNKGKKEFFRKYVIDQMKVEVGPEKLAKLPSTAPTSEGMDKVLNAYYSGGSINACFDSNARFWGRMVIADYYQNRTKELSENNHDSESVAKYVMAEIVLMTTFRCLPGGQMMHNIQLLEADKLFGLVDSIAKDFQVDIEELAAKKKK